MSDFTRSIQWWHSQYRCRSVCFTWYDLYVEKIWNYVFIRRCGSKDGLFSDGFCLENESRYWSWCTCPSNLSSTRLVTLRYQNTRTNSFSTWIMGATVIRSCKLFMKWWYLIDVENCGIKSITIWFVLVKLNVFLFVLDVPPVWIEIFVQRVRVKIFPRNRNLLMFLFCFIFYCIYWNCVFIQRRRRKSHYW